MGGHPDIENHRSGFVAVVGRPSVGKSTLLNAFLRQVVVPVSPRPQTTRRRQLAILSLADAQVVFVDTPGIHKPQHKLGEQMNKAALEALKDCDVILAIFDLSHAPSPDDARVAAQIQAFRGGKAVVAALNKLDLVPADEVGEHAAPFHELLPDAESIAVSATRGDGREALLQAVIDKLPLGPRLFPEDEITDAQERDIAADLIRAAALALLRHEVPHSMAVRVDEYKERGDSGAYIAATLFVERESQKGIVIGKNGAMLRELGTRARQQLEAMSGRKIYLDLRVKVLPGWRNDERALRRLGFGEPRS